MLIALEIPVNRPTNACITRPTGPKNLTNILPKLPIAATPGNLARTVAAPLPTVLDRVAINVPILVRGAVSFLKLVVIVLK